MGLDLMKYKNKSLECISCGRADTYGGPCIGKSDLSMKCLIHREIRSSDDIVREAKAEIRRLLME